MAYIIRSAWRYSLAMELRQYGVRRGGSDPRGAATFGT